MTVEPRDEAQEIVKAYCREQGWDCTQEEDQLIAEIRAYGERQRGSVHVCKEQVYMGEAAQYRGALDRIRAIWPHIEISRPKHFLDRSVYDPGAPTCLRCKIEDAIGQQPTPTDDCPTCGYVAWGRRMWESNGARFCAVCEARQEKADALTVEKAALARAERAEAERDALRKELAESEDEGAEIYDALVRLRERVRVLEESGRLTLAQLDEWNRAVESVIGRQPQTQMDTGVARLRAALDSGEKA